MFSYAGIVAGIGYTSRMSDTEIILHDGAEGNLYARVSPFGASLRGLWRETEDAERWDIVTGYTGRENKVGGQGDVLIPFPGRVKNGAYTFNAETYQMARNDKDGPNAIHGFVRQKKWRITEQTPDTATFETPLDGDTEGYPFPLRITVVYTATTKGLHCQFEVTNTGDTPAPVAAGFHPYFSVGGDLINDAVLTLPFDSVLEFDDKLIPTGNVLPVAGTPLDFRTPRPIGDTRFNTCYRNPHRDEHGMTRIRLASADGNRALTVWMNQAFDSLVLYSGDPLPESHRRRSLAIEPMTCGSDAFNHPEWGLRVLEPGETFTGTWGVYSD